MEIILIQDVDKVGKAGSVVNVKNGFARNFLIPNSLAVPLTNANLKKLEQEKQKKVSQVEKIRKDSEKLMTQLVNLSLTIPVLAKEDESLYGSITAREIACALKEEDFDLDKNCIILDEPIKSLGIYEVPVKLPPDVSFKVKVWIVKK